MVTPSHGEHSIALSTLCHESIYIDVSGHYGHLKSVITILKVVCEHLV